MRRHHKCQPERATSGRKVRRELIMKVRVKCCVWKSTRSLAWRSNTGCVGYRGRVVDRRKEAYERGGVTWSNRKR